MKVNLKIVERLVGFALPPVEELTARINAQLGGVEEIINLGERYEGALIVRVASVEKHPNADRLSVCLIDDGKVVDVERNSEGLVQVVCGAPNVRAGMWAIWLPPNSTVPASFDDDEPFVLSARLLRGVLSQGMLAAGDELALNDDHSAIIEITERDLPESTELRAGASFAEVFGLSGFVLDIENKMFTHRPDCFGQLGVAREIAGIFGKKFSSPEWYTLAQNFESGSGALEFSVENEIPELVPRLMAVALRDITVGPSPLWLQCELLAMGGKPINNVVDATNYIMMMTAQPTHAYDYDKLRGQKLVARMARAGETLSLLNGKVYELSPDDIVIADGERPVGLGGIMGGADSEVTNDTKNVVLECANFDMYAVRKISMRHGLFTDALARFNKGQSPLQNAAVIKRLMSMVGGEQASEVFDLRGDLRVKQADSRAISADDERDVSAFEWGALTGVLPIKREFINQRLGTKFSSAEICELLQNVEIKAHPEATNSSDLFEVIAPFWRTDLEAPEDIVEEVGRLYGFDNLPRELLTRKALAAPKNSRRELKQEIRQSLSKAGANEVLTYSFVHENDLKRAEKSTEHAYKLSNALSPDLQYYRTSVLVSLLDKVRLNIKAGHDEFMLFEIGKIHDKRLPLDSGDLPAERSVVEGVYASKKPREGAPFYRVRRMIEQMLGDVGAKFTFVEIGAVDDESLAPFEKSRSAQILSETGELLGVVGELRQTVRRNFKLPDYAAAFSIDIEKLQDCRALSKNYQPLSRFPSITQDISLRAEQGLSYAQLLEIVEGCLAEYPEFHGKVAPLSIYRPENSTTKTTTFRIKFTNYEKTLRDADIKPVMDHIASVALTKVDAERV